MTCKIDRHVTREDPVVLRICGRITGENVNTLRSLLEEENGTFAIDLKDVRSVDDEAVKLLAIHEINGAIIDNCPLYIREWITRERDAMRAGSHSVQK